MGLIGALVIATVISCAVIMTTSMFAPYEQKALHSKLRYSVEKLKGQTLRIPYASIVKSLPDNPDFHVCFAAEKGCSTLKPFTLLDPAGDYPIANGSGVTYDLHGLMCSSTFSDLCPFLLKTEALIINGDLEIHYTLNIHESVPIIQDKSWKISSRISYIKNLNKFSSIYYCSGGQVLRGIDSKGNAICVKRGKKNRYQFTGDYVSILNQISDFYDTAKLLMQAFGI